MILEHRDIQYAEDQYTSGVYPKRPLTVVRGEGSYVYDESGCRYLDLTSGMGVAVLGHAHPTITDSVTQQVRTLVTCPEIFYNDQRTRLYKTLSEITPGEINRFFLCNSGTEAVEGAIKAARLFTQRTTIIAAKRGFHGRTLGALGLTWNPHYREAFSGWMFPDIIHVRYGDLEAIEHSLTEDTAAVIVEVVQGEGGVHPAETKYIYGLREICNRRGVILIIDEIQTGIGRTGHWFACEYAGIVPDILTLGKGVAGGLPMGVVAWRDYLGKLPSGSHGSTFGGNPLVCAASIATINQLRAEGIPGRCMDLGNWVRHELESLDLPSVRAVRGLGLMVGIELRGRVTPVLKALQGRGVLALPAGKTVLRLLPPLNITQTDLKIGLDAIVEVLA